MAERKFYKNTITIAVLTDGTNLETAPVELPVIVTECTDGTWVNHHEDRTSVEVSAAEMRQLLTGAGSDPGFFGLDEDG